MPVINVRDAALHYEKSGEGTPPLLMIHGLSGGAWVWDDQMDRLAGEFTCISYDRRGHSRSEPGTRDQSYETHADDAAVLIESLGLDRPVLVGWSSGGRVAIDVMYKHRHLVRGAVLEEPAIFNVNPEARNLLMSDVQPLINDAVERGEPRAAIDAFFNIIAPDFWSQLDEESKNLHRDNVSMMFAAFEHSPVLTTPVEAIPDIDLPALVLQGSETHPTFTAVAGTLVELLPNARFAEVQDSGHSIHMTQSDEFARHVQLFARELNGAAAA